MVDQSTAAEHQFETVSQPDRWLSGGELLEAELPNDMQAALGHVIGEESIETLAAWMTEIRQHTDGHSISIDDLCHASEPTAHWAVMDEETYHFMCFYDAVVLAALSEQPVDIQTESPDGTIINAKAVGSDELTVAPSDAVFSLGVATDTPPSSDGELMLEDVYAAVCPYVKAFPHWNVYERWTVDVSAATVAMPLSGATHVADALVN